ncbi:hypothetical protein E6R60_10830 [Streptomyces sp. A0642]|uniref:hypothetical protein n=1 Tax=Streptomyces sp. A0642 TaxID=2563100 RepID=UPI0010A28C55|nr:hypothetical protein [Streptomyces sp. A0642]THA77057.1 hypothetical protein E6R60_10830 [Streptomyces sp. A0642]
MRVRYLGAADAPANPIDGRFHFSPGQECAVLELHVRSDGTSSLRIEHSPGDLAGLYSGRYFEQVSDVIPPQWSVEIYPQGGLSMGPKGWIEGDFWERMMERDPEAEAVFETTRDAILTADPITQSD